MTGGGARQRSGRMCLGSQAPRRQDDREAATELATAEKELAAGAKVFKDVASRFSRSSALALRHSVLALACCAGFTTRRLQHLTAGGAQPQTCCPSWTPYARLRAWRLHGLM